MRAAGAHGVLVQIDRVLHLQHLPVEGAEARDDVLDLPDGPVLPRLFSGANLRHMGRHGERTRIFQAFARSISTGGASRMGCAQVVPAR